MADRNHGETGQHLRPSEVMQRILDLIAPSEHPAPPPPPSPRKIGFSVKESPAKYTTRRRKVH